MVKYQQITDVNQVKERIANILQAPTSLLNPIFNDIKKTHGKMLRAQFCLLSHQFFAKESNKVLDAATSIEIIHLATLIHDDIIDNAKKRRGASTIQSKYGKDIAVYAGDFLFTKYFALINDTFADDPKLINANIKCMEKILEGELLQKNNLYNVNHTTSSELKIIKYKTAALFALSCFEGAYLADASVKQQNICAELGIEIGIAFQLQDDLIDLEITGKHLNKTTKQDFINGKYTLPLLYGLEQEPQFFKNKLSKQLTTKDVNSIIKKLNELGCISKVQELIKQHLQNALILIDQLPNSDSKLQFKKLCQTYFQL